MKQRVVRWLIIAGLKMVSILILLIPWKIALATGGFLGRVAYQRLKKERDRAWNNFNLAFGDSYNDSQKNEILKKSFENLSTAFS